MEPKQTPDEEGNNNEQDIYVLSDEKVEEQPEDSEQSEASRQKTEAEPSEFEIVDNTSDASNSEDRKSDAEQVTDGHDEVKVYKPTGNLQKSGLYSKSYYSEYNDY